MAGLTRTFFDTSVLLGNESVVVTENLRHFSSVADHSMRAISAAAFVRKVARHQGSGHSS